MRRINEAVRTARDHLGDARWTVSLAVAVFAAASPALAAYTLAPGDTVEVVVAGQPDLRAKAMIDVDGMVHLPLISAIQAAGLTLDALQAEVRRDLPQKTFRQRSTDGREIMTVVDPDEITIQISDYRPIYVRGDVAKPGDQVFRPGMTVRQAISLAGGYDIMRFRMGNPFLDSSDLRADYQTLWIDLARQQAHAAALQAEIDGKGLPDLTRAIKAPIPSDVLADIVRVETQQAKAQSDDYTRERSYLQQAAATAQTQMDTFTKPRSDAQQSEHDESEYKQRLSQLLDKGVIARDRVSDQQRSLLDSTQRYLDYSQRTSELAKARDDYNRQTERLGDQRRAALLKELQDANVAIADTRAKLQSVGEKLLYTGAVSSQLVRGSGGKPDIRINHAGLGDGSADVQGTENTVLTAGDTLEVSLKAEMTPEGVSN